MKLNWLNVSASLRYFFITVIGILNTTTFIPDKQIKLISFILSITVGALKAIDMLKGSNPSQNI